jgi:hypothetical protein
MITLKDGGAMERAMGALAKYRYTAGGEPVAPEGHPREWSRWLLEINSAEFEAIHDNDRTFQSPHLRINQTFTRWVSTA